MRGRPGIVARIGRAWRELRGNDRIDRLILAALSRSEASRPHELSQDAITLIESYAEIPAVYAAVFAIAHSFASVPITVSRRQSDGSLKPIQNHDLAAILDPRWGRPNTMETAYDLLETHASLLELSGQSFWRLDGPGVASGSSPPRTVRIMRPDRVRVTVDRDGRPTGYDYGTIGDSEKLLPNEVIHFKFFNPLDSVLGQPSVRAAKTAVLLDWYATNLNKEFFRNGAKLSAVLQFPDELDLKVVDALVEDFRRKYVGDGNRHRVAGISGSTKIDFPNVSNKDMEFHEGLKFATERVLMSMGVPPVLVTLLEGSHYANTEAQIKIFWNNTIIPKLRKRDAAINASLAPRWGPDIVVAFDRSAIPALRESFNEIRQTVNVFMSKQAMTPNEARQYLSTGELPLLPPLPGGDEIILPSPALELAAEKKLTSIETLISDVNAMSRSRRLDIIRSAGQASRARRAGRVARHAGIIGKPLASNWREQEKALKAAVDTIVESSRSDAPGRLMGSLRDVDDLIRSVSVGNREAITRAYRNLIGTFGQMAAKDLSRVVKADLSFDSVSDRVVEYFSKHALTKLTHLDRTTAEGIKSRYRSALIEAQLAGDNTIETARRIMTDAINDWYRHNDRFRSTRVFQTETTAAYNFSEHEAWTQSGVVGTKTWHTQGDDRVRGQDEDDEFDHSAMEGVEVPIDKTFSVPSASGFEAIMYPGDPAGSAGDVINCRCVLLPGEIQVSGAPKSPVGRALATIMELRGELSGNGGPNGGRPG